jgi:hemolysin III
VGMASSSVAALKPRWRGVSHQWGFFAAALAGLALIVVADTPLARLAVTIYTASLCAMLGASALYHRVSWSPRGAGFARRLDHSMIFVFVAGSYTPFALLVLDGTLAKVLLIVVWTAALVGATITTAWTHAPTWLRASLYVALGWAAVFAAPQLASNAGAGAIVLLALGGLLYTIGAIVYVRQRPDPSPLVFGYHEVFHAFVVGAAVVHFAAIAGYALPAA